MGILSIDGDKCKKDSLCALECPRQLISLKEDGTPFISPENEPRCMACGHCVVVCPHGALSIAGVPLEACPPIKPELGLNWEQVEQFLRSRRSIRVYKNKPVEREVLAKLIDTARYAPTGSNAQHLHWLVISGREKLAELSRQAIEWMREFVRQKPDSVPASYFRPVVASWDAGSDSILRECPALVVASGPGNANNGLVDASIALSYLELLALPLGLGTCWAGLLRIPMMNIEGMPEAMGLPAGNTLFYPMMIGYPKLKYHRLPERKPADITWR